MNTTCMTRVSKILRWLSLSLIFGGSIAIVLAVIVLVKSEGAKGIAVTITAANNAPVFMVFSRVALGSGILLLIGESLDYAVHKHLSKLVILRYAASLLCCAATMVFAFAIVPPMEQLVPLIATNAEAHAQFFQLHQLSRVVFGISILLAGISLLTPAFETLSPADTE